MAKLNIVNNDSIEIVTDNNIQQKFIEQERALLIEHLQHHFGNKALAYNVIIVETEASSQPIDKPLNTKEQYLKIIGVLTKRLLKIKLCFLEFAKLLIGPPSTKS